MIRYNRRVAWTCGALLGCLLELACVMNGPRYGYAGRAEGEVEVQGGEPLPLDEEESE